MFYAKFSINGVEKCKLYFDWGEYHFDTFSPDTKIIALIDFTVHGKDYQSRKASVESIGIDWSNSSDVIGLYYSDLAILSDWFYRNGKRYGLLCDFIENGLC